MEAGHRPDSPPLLEDMVGQKVKAVWSDACQIVLDFENGLVVEIEADEGELHLYATFGDQVQ